VGLIRQAASLPRFLAQRFCHAQREERGGAGFVAKRSPVQLQNST
jgi:hypothetical protein